MDNRIIRHAESEKRWKEIGQARPLTIKGVVDALEYGRRLPDGSYALHHSPKIRATQTAEAIKYSLGDRVKVIEQDVRLDIVNFLSGHSPDVVGGRQAYIDCITLMEPDALFVTPTKYAAYILDNLGNNNVIGVSHDIPIGLFFYACGIIDENPALAPSLSGFGYDFVKEEGSVLFKPDYIDVLFLVKTGNLEDLAAGKIKHVFRDTKISGG